MLSTLIQAAVYGEDHDSALHLAIKKNAVHAAMSLIENGANLDFPNSKVRHIVMHDFDIFVICIICLQMTAWFSDRASHR